ncbi:MAG: gamma carbonic anhydrase family protein [Gemmatimonadetes bacterium]|nr:gamma carbonic anhydrase family protein [Gemmatimonadota bacterium]
MIRSLGELIPRVHGSAFVAESATIIGDVDIGPQSSIWFGAVVRGDHPDYGIRLGPRCNVQDNAVLHVSAAGPTVLEAEVTVGHGAVLESCAVGRRCVIGMNAVVLQGARLGEGCLVAAGAVVKAGADVPPRSLVAGVPGRVRPLTETAQAWIEGSASHYVDLSRHYLETWPSLE